MGTRPLSVLVVDDNKRVLASLEPGISRKGFVPWSCSSFSEASARIRDAETPPEAGLLDVWLGREGDGFDLVRQLRQRFGDSVSCAIMSGYAADASVLESVSELGTVFLPKPIGSGALGAFLSEAIARSLLPQPAVRGAVLGFARDHELSPQETRIVAKLASGTLRSELADALSLSRDTLKWQVRSILNKTSLPSTDHVMSDVLRRASAIM